MSDIKNVQVVKTVPMEDYIVGYEITWEEGTRLILKNILWSAILFLIAVLI